MVKVCWTTRDWAEAVASLPADGPLPCRTVLVPRERVAHSLRREILRAGRADALAGTRFLAMPVAAIAVLRAGAIAFTPGEEALRPARLLALFRQGLEPEHFPLELLRSKPGWDEAFAHTILDLEGTGLRPDDLEGPGGSPRLTDVAGIWRAVDDSASRSWTTPRIYHEAALVLEREPGLWPFPGAVLAPAQGHTTAAEARFLRAIPRLTLGILAARPLRTHYVDRMKALFGSETAEAVLSSSAPRSSSNERDILASYLFEAPAVLADAGRPRSSGRDGTADLEEYSGVEAEVEATADWVAQQLLTGTPLEDIGVLVPAIDPLAGLVATRLARLPWADVSLPVHVASGLPLIGTAVGARALALIRALRAHLSGDSLAEVLPALRSVAPDGRHLSRGAAMDLAWSLGTAGGNPARPEGALEWATRAAEREDELEAQLDRARAAADDPEKAGLARTARDLERLLTDLRAVRPALGALVGVARLAVGGATLTTLWPALRTFLKEWLLQPGEGARVEALLNERLSRAAAEGACATLIADDALCLIEETIGSIRLSVGRFGEPAVYVGTVTGATGLRFRAVRVIGLAEGHLPAVPREDPVVPDVLRARLAAPGAGDASVTPPTAADRALESLHALDSAIRDAEQHVTLSAPRLDIERSLREPASVILEAAAALGRPNPTTGERTPIPDVLALRRNAFVPARAAALEFRHRTPIGEAAWQDGVARGVLGTPGRWRLLHALDLARVAALRDSREPGPLDGILGAAATDIPVPGLSPDWPISPSVMTNLVQCPHLFLLGNLLGFEEPASAPSQRQIGQPAYGALFHRVAEEFYRAHGEQFCAHEDELGTWRARADAMVERVFEEFLQQYPLVGRAVRDVERERVRRDFHDLIDYDWALGPRRFVGVERAFGRPTPITLPAGSRSLFVRGQIDRIDVDGPRALVRDLKTGRAHPRLGREAKPDPVLDFQLAVYGLAAQALAEPWSIPNRIAAAYAYVNRGTDERSYRRDFHEALEPAAREWLAIAGDLLADRSFPRTPNEKDCSYCRFRPVCGKNAYDRATQVLAAGPDGMAGFRAMKGIEPEEES